MGRDEVIFRLVLFIDMEALFKREGVFAWQNQLLQLWVDQMLVIDNF